MSASMRGERLAPAILFAAGLATILGAWGFQLAGYVPCELCLQERLPYYVGVPVALAALLAAVAGAKPTVPRLLLIVAGLIFAYGIYLGIYHAGAEWRFWMGPTECSGGSALSTTTGDLLNALKRTHVVSCIDPAFRFPAAPWGISLAGANALISIFLVAAAFWGAFRPLAREEEAAAAPQT
jgi:disulfide bond formation protein DsbB